MSLISSEGRSADRRDRLLLAPLGPSHKLYFYEELPVSPFVIFSSLLHWCPRNSGVVQASMDI